MIGQKFWQMQDREQQWECLKVSENKQIWICEKIADDVAANVDLGEKKTNTSDVSVLFLGSGLCKYSNDKTAKKKQHISNEKN